jgi:hypothetical protein
MWIRLQDLFPVAANAWSIFEAFSNISDYYDQAWCCRSPLPEGMVEWACRSARTTKVVESELQFLSSPSLLVWIKTTKKDLAIFLVNFYPANFGARNLQGDRRVKAEG